MARKLSDDGPAPGARARPAGPRRSTAAAASFTAGSRKRQIALDLLNKNAGAEP